MTKRLFSTLILENSAITKDLCLVRVCTHKFNTLTHELQFVGNKFTNYLYTVFQRIPEYKKNKDGSTWETTHKFFLNIETFPF